MDECKTRRKSPRSKASRKDDGKAGTRHRGTYGGMLETENETGVCSDYMPVGYGGGRKGLYGTAGEGVPGSHCTASQSSIDDSFESRQAGVYGMRESGSFGRSTPGGV